MEFLTCELTEISIEPLQVLRAEAQREISRRQPLHPVSIIDEWRKAGPNRLVQYNFELSESSREWLCTLSLCVNGDQEDFMTRADRGTRDDKIDGKKNAKRVAAQQAIDSGYLSKSRPLNKCLSKHPISVLDEWRFVDATSRHIEYRFDFIRHKKTNSELSCTLYIRLGKNTEHITWFGCCHPSLSKKKAQKIAINSVAQRAIENSFLYQKSLSEEPKVEILT